MSRRAAPPIIKAALRPFSIQLIGLLPPRFQAKPELRDVLAPKQGLDREVNGWSFFKVAWPMVGAF